VAGGAWPKVRTTEPMSRTWRPVTFVKKPWMVLLVKELSDRYKCVIPVLFLRSSLLGLDRGAPRVWTYSRNGSLVSGRRGTAGLLPIGVSPGLSR